MNCTIENKEVVLETLKLFNDKNFYKILSDSIEKRESSIESKVLFFRNENEIIMIYLNGVGDVLEKSRDLKKIFVVCGNVETGQSEHYGPYVVNEKIDIDLSFLKNVIYPEDFDLVENGIKNHLKNLDNIHEDKMNALRSDPEKLYDLIENNEIDSDDVHYFLKDDKKAISSLLVEQLLNSKKFDNVVSENLYNKQMKNEFKECKIKESNEIDYEHFVIRFFNHMKNLNIISIVFPKVLKIANQLEPEKLRNILENFNDERFIKEFEKYNQIKYKHFKRDIK